MRVRLLTTSVLLGLVSALFSVLPAEARTTPATDFYQNSIASGLLVQYKPGISITAPNGEPTGENFAGVKLIGQRTLGGRLASMSFATDLTASQQQDALNNLKKDPRVESVTFDNFIEPNWISSPISIAIFQNKDAVTLPLVIKSAIRVAAAPMATATDAWNETLPSRARVKLTWVKPTTRISGSIVGYRVQLRSAGVWKTLVTQTAATARSFTTASTLLSRGVSNTLRVAAISSYAGRKYVGAYRSVTVVPTTIPTASSTIKLENAPTELRVSWTPLTKPSQTGGLPVSYSFNILDELGNVADCVTTSDLSCVVSNPVNGRKYISRLTITNSHGSVNIIPVTATYSAFTPVVTSNDSYFNKQWHLKSSETYGMKVTNAWRSETGFSDVVVAVFDTGITSHPDLDSQVLPGYDFVSDSANNPSRDGDGWDSDPSDPGDWTATSNSSWHGTHVAGIIAAADNSVGVIGVAPNVKILPVRVLSAGGGTTSDIIAGLKWAMGIHIAGVPDNPNPADIINLSIGGTGQSCDTFTSQLLAQAKARGIVVVTASGNENAYGSNSYPGNCYPTINVAASGYSGRPTFYSNFGDAVDIGAPGGDPCQPTAEGNGGIYSTMNSGSSGPGSPTWAFESGTSMAAPNVSGVIALLYSAKLRTNPQFVPDSTFVESIWAAIRDTATPYSFYKPVFCRTVNGTTNYGKYGAGIINAEAALAAILR